MADAVRRTRQIPPKNDHLEPHKNPGKEAFFFWCLSVVFFVNGSDFWFSEDPLAKLAHFKELQAKYAAVKEQRERAESTNRLLQQMPTAGNEET